MSDQGTILYETVLPKRVVPQPTPLVLPGGDCGACVFGGLVGKTVPEVYEFCFKGEPKSFHWDAMCTALHEAEREGLIDRLVMDVPIWPWELHSSFCEWGLHGSLQGLAWFNYVQMAVDAGYYAMALVDADKKGPFGGGTNHWIMLVGTRQRRVLHPTLPVATIHNEVLVSCSSRRTPAEEWVGQGPFLSERGGFNLLLARPTSEGGS